MICVNCGCNAEVLDKGRLINQKASLGSLIVTLNERILQLANNPKKVKELAETRIQLSKAESELERLNHQV